MSASENLTKPSIVIVGFWNQAIINQPAWIGQHVLGLQDGDSISGNIILVDEPEGQKQIFFYGNFGIACRGNRLELYRVPGRATTDLLNIASSLIGKLPHTPVFAVGFNLNFFVSDDEAIAIRDAIETREGLDALGKVYRAERAETLSLRIEGIETTLNLRRVLQADAAELSFNYEIAFSETDIVTVLRPEVVTQCAQHADEIVNSIYGLQVTDEITFEGGSG